MADETLETAGEDEQTLETTLVTFVRRLSRHHQEELLAGLLRAFPPVRRSGKVDRPTLDKQMTELLYEVEIAIDLVPIDLDALDDPAGWMVGLSGSGGILEMLFKQYDAGLSSRLAQGFIDQLDRLGYELPSDYSEDDDSIDLDEFSKSFRSLFNGWRELAISACIEAAAGEAGPLRLWTVHASLPARSDERPIVEAERDGGGVVGQTPLQSLGNRLFEALPDARREMLTLRWLGEGLGEERQPGTESSGSTRQVRIARAVLRHQPADFVGKHGVVIVNSFEEIFDICDGDGALKVLFLESNDKYYARELADSFDEMMDGLDQMYGTVVVRPSYHHDSTDDDDDIRPTDNELWAEDFSELLKLWRQRVTEAAVRGLRRSTS